MFSCCGCNVKSAARGDSDDENYDNEKRNHGESDGELKSIDNKGYQEEKENPVSNNECPDHVSVSEQPAALPYRKSSIKKPKPRLSISTEVKIIPDPVICVELQDKVENEEDCHSPLSDEVFAGAGSDPPRGNLGVVPAGAACLEFPRSPLLDVPSSPRAKPPTPHPKRASMPAVLPQWLSEEEDEGGGQLEPPVTPVRQVK